MSDKETIAVWFSCGAASAVAAYETLRLYGARYNIRIVNNPVVEEHPDNLRFLADCEKWFGQKIEFAINNKWPDCSAHTVWTKRKFMGNNRGAICTEQLKKKARAQWEAENTRHGMSGWMVFGFTADEKARHDKFVMTERQNVIPVLIDLGYTKQDCMNIVASHGIKLPEMYALGFPNANCIGCIKATSPTYWNHVRKHFPAVFWQRALLAAQLGVRLVRYKGERIFLHHLPEDAQGRPLASLVMPECGIFCEEYAQ